MPKITLIKTQKLKQTSLNSPDDTVVLNGFCINLPVETLGVNLTSSINSHQFGIYIHIVQEETTDMSFDVLIGNDSLLTEPKANIDVDNVNVTTEYLPFPININ